MICSMSTNLEAENSRAGMGYDQGETMRNLREVKKSESVVVGARNCVTIFFSKYGLHEIWVVLDCA